MIKQKDAILKNQKQMLHKRYCNKMLNILKITKEAYYKKYFQNNRKKPRALWSGINEIIYSKNSSKTIPPSSISAECQTISYPQNIAENFNNFVTSIIKNIQKKSCQLKTPSSLRNFSLKNAEILLHVSIKI